MQYGFVFLRTIIQQEKRIKGIKNGMSGVKFKETPGWKDLTKPMLRIAIFNLEVIQSNKDSLF